MKRTKKIFGMGTAFVLAAALFFAGCASSDSAQETAPVISDSAETSTEENLTEETAGTSSDVTIVDVAEGNEVQEETDLLEMDRGIVSGELENGMKYYVKRNTEPQNRIFLKLVLNAGSAMEEDDQKGVAHFIEHLSFRGTKHFEKNSLIKYFESLGMAFGPEVNAETSFERTIYKLEIPADDTDALAQGLLVLRDWAADVSFNPDDIETERGVIQEEWRGYQNVNNRIMRNLYGFLYKDSVFEDSFAIGDMEIIKTVPPERIMDFYKKWYRPELMSVVVTGDFNSDQMVDAIKAAMGDIPASSEKIEKPEFPVSDEGDDIIAWADKDLSYSSISLLSHNGSWKPVLTEEDFREDLIESYLTSILTHRLAEISNKPESPWLGASVTTGKLTNYTSFTEFNIIPKDGMIWMAFAQALDELDRFNLYGVTEGELERDKAASMKLAEDAMIRKAGVHSDTYASEIIDYILCGTPVLSRDYYYSLYCRISSEITLEDVNAAAAEFLSDRTNRLFIMVPESFQDMPSDEDIMNFWKNYHSEQILSEYEDDAVTERGIMDRPETKAAVIAAEKIPELGATSYTLENGMKVLMKKTDLETDTVYLKLISKGGHSKVSEEDYPSVLFSPYYALYSGVNGLNFNQLIKAIAATNINVNIGVNMDSEFFSGSCSSDSFEQTVQIAHCLMNNPQFNEDGWNQVMLAVNQTLKNTEVSSYTPLQLELSKLRFGDYLPRQPINEKFVSLMDPVISEEGYLERFGNPSDFTAVIVGDFDEEKILELCCYYLGTIEPVYQGEENAEYELAEYPDGVIETTVRKGVDPVGYVVLAFGGRLPAAENTMEAWKDNELIYQLAYLLHVQLQERIRVDLGGTYGVNVSSAMEGYTDRCHEIFIEFGCEPERCEELADEIIRVIKDIQKNGFEEANIASAVETYRRNKEGNLKSNEWWLEALIASEVFNVIPRTAPTDTETVPTGITGEKLKELANSYLDTDNYIKVILNPEEAE